MSKKLEQCKQLLGVVKELSDHLQLVQQRLDSTITILEKVVQPNLVCWKCGSNDIFHTTDGWICNKCSQHGPLGVAENKEEGCLKNVLYKKTTS